MPTVVRLTSVTRLARLVVAASLLSNLVLVQYRLLPSVMSPVSPTVSESAIESVEVALSIQFAPSYMSIVPLAAPDTSVSVRPARFDEPPPLTQTPLTAKHPESMSMPLAKVLVAELLAFIWPSECMVKSLVPVLLATDVQLHTFWNQ